MARIALKRMEQQSLPILDSDDFFRGDVALSATPQPSGLKVLGYTIFKRLRKVLVPVDVLPELWRRAGLPDRYLPSPPDGSDVFRSAAMEAFNVDGRDLIEVEFRNKRFTTEQGDEVVLHGPHRIRLMLRSVKGEEDEILRAVVREIVSKEKKSLFHGTIINLRWDKLKKSYTVDYVPGAKEEYDYGIYEDRFHQLFKLYMTHFGRPTIARMIFEVLQDNYAVHIFDQSGFYFVGKEYEQLAHSIKTFIESLAPYAVEPGNVPLCNLATTVETKHDRENIVAGVVSTAQRILSEIQYKIEKREEEGKKVTRNQIKEFEEKRAYLERTVDYYRQLLDAELDAAQMIIKVIESRISELASQVTL